MRNGWFPGFCGCYLGRAGQVGCQEERRFSGDREKGKVASLQRSKPHPALPPFCQELSPLPQPAIPTWSTHSWCPLMLSPWRETCNREAGCLGWGLKWRNWNGASQQWWRMERRHWCLGQKIRQLKSGDPLNRNNLGGILKGRMGQYGRDMQVERSWLLYGRSRNWQGMGFQLARTTRRVSAEEFSTSVQYQETVFGTSVVLFSGLQSRTLRMNRHIFSEVRLR